MSEAQFVEIQKQLMVLVDSGNLNGIRSLIDEAQIGFPEKLDQTSLWDASFYATLGKQKEAIAALDNALNQGVWWNPHTLIRDPELQDLQNLEQFNRILKKCEKLLESSRRDAKSELFIFGNQQADTGIFSLHWKASNVGDFSSYWLDDEQDYLFGFPQSSQVYGYNSYCWDEEDLAIKEIENTYRDFREGSGLKQCILAGASQGGKLALELSLGKKLPGINGFIAVVPAIRDLSQIENLLKENESNVRGCIITGDRDPFYKKNLELMPVLEKNGIQCHLIVKKGLGHFFPSDFGKVLPEAVDYVLDS